MGFEYCQLYQEGYLLLVYVLPMLRDCFLRLEYRVTPRKYQLSSEMLNERLISNAFYSYRESFLSRDVKNVLRYKLHCEPADSADSDSDSNCDKD